MQGSSGLENFRLTVFRAVAEQKSFRRAAEVLRLSQPGVTQQIKSLEREMGVALFDRSGRAVELTAAGAVLLRFAEESHAVLLRGQREMAELDGRVSGPLRLAVSTTIAQYVLSPMLGRFVARYPGVEVQMLTANTDRVAAAVLDGAAEVGLVEGPVHRQELKLEAWLRDRLVLVVAKDHAWAGRASIELGELAGARILLRERGSGTREIVEGALRAAIGEVEGFPAMELNSTEALLGFVEAELGVGFCSRAAVRRQVRLGTLAVVAVKGLKIGRDLSFVTLRSGEARGNAAVLMEFLREQAGGGREPDR